MASSYKQLSSADRTIARTILNESIPITASVITGTYNHENVKQYSHGMWTSYYDYPYLSSSANHLLDLTVGYSPLSDNSSSANTQNAKKINIYNQMCASLVGFDHTGSLMEFDDDGNIIAGGNKHRTCFFMLFSRLLVKDGIKRGSFRLQMATSSLSANTPDFTTAPLISDDGAENDYRTNSPAGEYGILYKTDTNHKVGLIYYQAGVCVVSSSIFSGSFGRSNHADTSSFEQIVRQQEISGATDGLDNYFDNVSFVNTTELNSTIYFCRLNHNEFNYSSNPTFTSGSKIVTKTNADDPNTTYLTGISLCGPDGAVLATAKFSEPVKKTSDSEITARVRLDYGFIPPFLPLVLESDKICAFFHSLPQKVFSLCELFFNGLHYLL